MTSDTNFTGGCIILLDVPPGSAITLDGVTRITPSPSSASAATAQPIMPASSPFHRGLWIISSINSKVKACDDFHLLVVRSGMNKIGSNASGDCRNLPVGFVLLSSTSTTLTDATGLGQGWIFARRYDPYTEEISNEPVDELTVNNLSMAMKVGGELAKFVMSYDQFMGASSNGNSSGNKINNIPSWETRTSHINARHLLNHHCIRHGNKIVPSSESDNDVSTAATTINNLKTDGTPISYPSIPCIDQTVSARQLAQHCGTRSYLSKLSPEKRTWLLFGTGTEEGASDEGPASPGEHVWRDVVHGRYSKDGSCDNSKGENDFLADVELSFLLFLFLECHASLEHWRDAISMCALSTPTNASANILIQRPHFFQKLLSLLYHQLSCIETEFFRDVEYSSGENNFMVGALRRLCNACECVGKRKRDGDTVNESLKSTCHQLRQLVRERFGLDLSQSENNGDGDMDIDDLGPTILDDDGIKPDSTRRNSEIYNNQEEEDDEEEDGPVIVPFDQIEASLERTYLQTSQASKWRWERIMLTADQQHHQAEYPLLHAAMSPGEDEVMACARILDEAKDVSLVREAAAYLEEVEAHRRESF